MKNKNKYTTALLIAIMCITLASCDLFEKEDNSFGDSKVGFEVQSQTVNLAPDDAGTVAVTVQLIAEQRNEDITFNVSAVDSLTTAVEGMDYSLPAGTATIPANSSAVDYLINVSGEDLSVNETRTLALRVEGTDNIESAEILGLYTLSLVGTE